MSDFIALTQYEVVDLINGSWGIKALIICTIIIFISAIMVIATIYCNKAIVPLTFVAIGILCIAFIITLFLVKPNSCFKREIRYKGYVSDDVNFNEFMEKCDIIDRDGKLYTITIRED